MKRSTTKKAVCVWCKGECGVVAKVENDHLLSLRGDPHWPRRVWPPTNSCVRLKAAKEYFYHPDRINFPLKRIGEKGEGRWQRIPWDQALDEIAEKMETIAGRYGWESISWSMGTGYRTEPPLLARFFRSIGSPNNCMQGQICFLPRAKIADAITGYFPHFSVGPKTRCIVMYGAEPLIARPITARAIQDAQKGGAKIIVIDPRRTRIARKADLWLQLRPGTDVALLLGMIHVIVEEKLYDAQFVENWCHGFQELRERIREYPPQVVSSITTIDAEKIAEAARMYAHNRPGCFVEGMGVEHLQDVAQALHARWILAGLTGNIDVEGGEEHIGPHPVIRRAHEASPQVLFPPGQLEKQIGSDRFKLFSWNGSQLINDNLRRVWGKAPETYLVAHGPSVFRAMVSGKPYPIRSMFTIASNPMVTMANTKLVYRALKSLDLYVVSDFFMTPSAALADYVLAPASWLERPILHEFSGYAHHVIAGEAALPASIPGEYDHKTDYDVYRELAHRLGKADAWPWRNLEAYYDHLLEPTGLTHREYVHQRRCEQKPQQFEKYRERGFATPTGKIEFSSTIFEKFGRDPLPAFREPQETPLSDPQLARDYPLRLITGGRVREYYHSEWRQIASVRSNRPDPIVQVHPDTAAELDISQGDWVWIETVRGRIRQKAELFGGIDRRVVHAEHGWWYPELPEEEPWLHGVWESNINVVLNEDPEVCNDITGGWPLKNALCRIYKVKDYNRGA